MKYYYVGWKLVRKDTNKSKDGDGRECPRQKYYEPRKWRKERM